jgi:hypothetical protein
MDSKAGQLPVRSSVLYGEEGRWAKGADQRTSEKRVLTMKDLVAPQRIELFTITFELVTKSKRAVNR